MIVIFIFILIAVGLLSTKILHRYISIKKIPWYVYISVWIGWFMCFSIVILVPIDILCTDYRQCKHISDSQSEKLNEIITNISNGTNSGSNNNNNNNNEIINKYDSCEEPWAYISNDKLEYIYQTFYFGTLLLTWLVYPLMGSFVLAGDFHLSGRITRSIKENAYLYLIFGVIGLVVMIWLLAVKQLDWNSMVGFAMAAANTWGLCLVIILMGYGLVETPRSIWVSSQRSLVLKHLQFKAVELLNSKKKANEELIATMKVIRRIQEKTKKYDPYEKYIKIIVDQCPPEQYALVQRGEGDGEATYSVLVALNSRLKNAITNSQRAEFLYDQCLVEAFELQDIQNSAISLDKNVNWSFREQRQGRFAKKLDIMEWIWYNYLEISVFRVAAIVFAVLSLLIIWSEFALAFTSFDISVLSNIVKHSNVSNIFVQFILFFPLGYEALTCYSTLFKIRIFNYYRLIPHQHSDSNSIIFSAAYLCRLGAPLCYNFIQFINMNSGIEDNRTSFSVVMGTMNVAPFLGTYFYIYFPLLIVIVCLSTLFNVYSRIMNCLNISKFRFDVDFSHEQIDEGKFLIDSERRKWTQNNIKPLSSKSPPPSLDSTSNNPKQIFKSGSTTISKQSPPNLNVSGGNINNNNTNNGNTSSARSFIDSFLKKSSNNNNNNNNNNNPYEQTLLFDESNDFDDDDDIESGGAGRPTYNAHLSSSFNGGANSTSISGYPQINKMFGGANRYSQLPKK
ncbi:hypothetical protein DDB_G0284019 [Dictyostelium discoideum AX4]|uniref:LMBR1 domain-containing protein 2 homolog A n=1 Tax=Dictyostelium discoideum TaxID=44689 RepID=LMD2A_DICDI|nr:hypothetical protein DDB_G0284019 [Dictyostelium discoideum AX4]Q54Q92.1 RecName: Full=LMBR1 domain-containing protein 2 homolog A [Dictyostelium discoideum]EAL65433.1 hypothetical protein DDB_G0284019 [Dictyostelium discoideum AX4]|eukprot:XP_638788.1 hypothetical protein DDB_G0284019 [Dictyostelium discoideum AX4]